MLFPNNFILTLAYFERFFLLSEVKFMRNSTFQTIGMYRWNVHLRWDLTGQNKKVKTKNSGILMVNFFI